MYCMLYMCPQRGGGVCTCVKGLSVLHSLTSFDIVKQMPDILMYSQR